MAISRSRVQFPPESPEDLFTKAGLRTALPKRLARVSLPADVLLNLHDLYEEMQRFGSGNADAAALHFMRGICRLLHADSAFWVGAVRLQSGAAGEQDFQYGWRGRSVLPLRTSGLRRSVIARAMKAQDGGAPCLATQAIAAGAGRRRVRRLRELVSFPAYRRTAHFRAVLAPFGLVDRLYIVTPVNADVESYFVFSRERTRRRFSEEDSLLAGLAVRWLKGLHRDLLLSRGLLVGKTPLTPGERQVLRLLLGKLTEKNIEARLSLSRSTVHQHVGAIFKKLGVNSRHALMALWIEQ